jgi:hypothetical protein
MSNNKHGCCADKACNDKTCMELPAGKTCGDCGHFRHCEAFYAHKATDTYCDFYPRRFRERAPAAGVTPTEGGQQ